jgi:TonB family protein
VKFLSGLAVGLVLAVPPSEDSQPRFQSGGAPSLPPLAAAGGLVVVEAQIGLSGIVEDVVIIDDAPPFTETVVSVVKLWRFRPATSDGGAVSSRASVVALYRAPILMGGAPPPPTRTRAPSKEAPYPIETRTPAFPPQSIYEGVVMVEAEVDRTGRVENAAILSSAPGLDDVALEAARAFRFEPAERDGRPVRSYAIVVFAIPQPVTSPRLRR